MSKEVDLGFGDVKYKKPTEAEDTLKGIDAVLGDIPFAWRKRRISVDDYGEISIRYRRETGSRTEYEKILSGEIEATCYGFEFSDAFVLCTVSDIRTCLLNKQFSVKGNHDRGEGKTWAAYISLSNIKHLMVRKGDK